MPLQSIAALMHELIADKQLQNVQSLIKDCYFDKAQIPALIIALLKNNHFDYIPTLLLYVDPPHLFTSVAAEIYEPAAVKAFIDAVLRMQFLCLDQHPIPYGLAIAHGNFYFFKEFPRLRFYNQKNQSKLIQRVFTPRIVAKYINDPAWFAVFIEHGVISPFVQFKRYKAKLEAVFTILTQEVLIGLLLKATSCLHLDWLLETLDRQVRDDAVKASVKLGLSAGICNDSSAFSQKQYLQSNSDCWKPWLQVFSKHGITSPDLRLWCNNHCEPVFHPYLANYVTAEDMLDFLESLLKPEMDVATVGQIAWLLDLVEHQVARVQLLLNTWLPMPCIAICIEYMPIQLIFTKTLCQVLDYASLTHKQLDPAVIRLFLRNPYRIDFSMDILHLLIDNATCGVRVAPTYSSAILEPLLQHPLIDWAARNNQGQGVLLRLMQAGMYALVEKVLAISCKQAAARDPALASWDAWPKGEMISLLGLQTHALDEDALDSFKESISSIEIIADRVALGLMDKQLVTVPCHDIGFSEIELTQFIEDAVKKRFDGVTKRFKRFAYVLGDTEHRITLHFEQIHSIPREALARHFPQHNLPAHINKFSYDLAEYCADNGIHFTRPLAPRSIRRQFSRGNFSEHEFFTVKLLLQCNPHIESLRIGRGIPIGRASLLTCATVLKEHAPLYSQLRAQGKRHLPSDLYFKLGVLEKHSLLDQGLINNFIQDMQAANLPAELPAGLSQMLHCAMATKTPLAFNQILDIFAACHYVLQPEFVQGHFSREYIIGNWDVLDLDGEILRNALRLAGPDEVPLGSYHKLFNKYPSLEHDALIALINSTPALQNSAYWKKLRLANTTLSFNHLINHLRGLHKTPWYCFWSAHYSGKNTASLFDKSFVEGLEKNTWVRNRALLIEQLSLLIPLKNVLQHFQPTTAAREEALPTLQELKEHHQSVNWDYSPNTCFNKTTLAQHLSTVCKEAPEKYKRIAEAKTPELFKAALASHRGFFALGKTTSVRLYNESKSNARFGNASGHG